MRRNEKRITTMGLVLLCASMAIGEMAGTVPGTRTNAADVIMAEALAEEDVHNCFGRIERLAELKATPQLIRLYSRDTNPECCVYQAIWSAIAGSTGLADMPALFLLFDVGVDENRSMLRSLLAEISGQTDGGNWTRAQWETWWQQSGRPAELRFNVRNCFGEAHVSTGDVEVLNAGGQVCTGFVIKPETAEFLATSGCVTNRLGTFEPGCSGGMRLHAPLPAFESEDPNAVITIELRATCGGVPVTGRTVVAHGEW